MNGNDTTHADRRDAGLRLARRLAGVGTAFLFFDLLLILISGGTSLVDFGRSPVTSAGFLLRLGLFGVLFGLRLRVLAEPALRLSRSHVLLALLLLPTLAEFHLAGGRIGGDGMMYFVYTRSLAMDGDLDFTNEYAHFGLLERGDLSMPTRTGLRRSIFAVGPGLMALPFFEAGHGVARGLGALGQPLKLDGYGPPYTNAVALGGLLYGFLALLLVHALLRRHFRAGTALGATLLLWGTTFLYWYMVQQPAMSHAPSACLAALVLFLWDRSRTSRSLIEPGGAAPHPPDPPRLCGSESRPAASLPGYLLFGLALGFSMCVRWQNGVLLLLPALDLLSLLRSQRSERVSRAALSAAALALGALLGALPQLWAWKTIYGEWLLRYPPHGADFLRLDHPFALETLFSSRHGLLSWTPVFWAGFLGFLPLARRRPQLALPLLPPLVLMTYVNMCSGDWWAGGSFSNRRFDSLLPLFALGFAASIDALLALVRRRPQLALALFALPFCIFNLALAEEVHRGLVPRDDTVDFSDLVRGGAQVLSDTVGSPNTWPASWLFAWRYERSPGQYDLLVGRYLFYRQNNLQGVIPLGQAGDEPFLGEGWARRESADGLHWRRVRERARVFVPLDVAEDLELRLRVQGPPEGGELELQVNGRSVGRTPLGPEWRDVRLAVARGFWRRELNELVLVSPGETVRVAGLSFAQRGGR